MTKKNTKRGEFYWVGDRPYISVTTILKVIDKPALRYWFGKKVYSAVIKDPSLNQNEAMKAPWRSSGKAKTRGSTIHSFVEQHRQGGDVEKMVASLKSNIRPYGEAFLKWITDNDINFVEHERTVLSHQHGYAGTADMRCHINGNDNIWLLDVKTGKDIYDEVELQLSAYKQGYLEENEQVDRIGVLLLETGKDNKPTGNYKFQEMSDRLDEFLAAKKLWEWKNQEKLEEYQYFNFLEGGDK